VEIDARDERLVLTVRENAWPSVLAGCSYILIAFPELQDRRLVAMQELIKHFIDAPIPNLCVLGGLVFLAIAVVGNISGKIEPGKVGRIAAGILGSLLLIYGIASHANSDAEAKQRQQPPTQPVPIEERAFTPMQVDTDLFGGDYQGLDIVSPDACQAECKRDTRCRAWTFVKVGAQGPQARCYLKDHIPAAKPNPCCISSSLKQP
jgi:hypothetical protein